MNIKWQELLINPIYPQIPSEPFTTRIEHVEKSTILVLGFSKDSTDGPYDLGIHA
jgi:hypothetical protein